VIDPEQLRQLGWSEGLIEEVTRQASAIEQKSVGQITAPPTANKTVGASVFLQPGIVPNAVSRYFSIS